ncbi:Zn-ribbon domain-containing OB-fold protein [Saccharopolyspora montiporae]|uniref:Zn-ribbon domain-containing OB-fold protein n=1 Tax=Saccharopolyspora montiporae TaxID=2781240 RepID=UPI00351C5746
MSEPLSAPLDIGFDYTRSLGPVLSRFATGLREGRILGIRGSDGRVHVPPAEFDPKTAERLDDFVQVSTTGTVVTWSWMPEPAAGQPLSHPFGWALIRLDGADTPMLHAVDAGAPERMSTGMRVRVRWAAERGNGIRDIECFEPASDTEQPSPQPDGDADGSAESEPVGSIIAPVHLSYQHSASPEESRYLRALREGRLVGQRCPVCRKVYIPPRGACPTDGVPTDEEVELADTGTVTTFCIVNVPFLGQRIQPPYVSAYVLLDGADIPFLHLVLGCNADEVRMGMRVRGVWKPRDEWEHTLQNIDHFEPSGEPDAPFESYAQHL